MPSVALVTCVNMPEPDPDEALLLETCKQAGLDVELAAWDDPSVDWSRFQVAVLRSTWDFHEHEEAFRNWVTSVSEKTRLLNPPDLILRTLDKTYLAELELSGVPIVPTHFLDEHAIPGKEIKATGWKDFVVKPTVSGGSFMTKRFSRSELQEAAQFAFSLRKTHRAMVQPYMSRVESGGEVALVHIDGELTHGVLKNPRFVGQEEAVSEAVEPTPEQAAAAKLVIDTIEEPWLYARVDLMQADDGQWLLSELEVIEPSLFLLQHPPALDRFVTALGNLV